MDRADSCRRLTERVLATKRLLVESYRLQGIPATLIREAIVAAEAEAWRCGFPQLFLPDLADEIVRQLQENRASRHPGYAQAA